MSDYRGYPTCRHVMTTGRYCQCPAIKGTTLCANHTEEHKRRRNLAKARARKRMQQGLDQPRSEADLNAEIFDSLQLPGLENTLDIAVVLSNTTHLLGGGHISARKAEAIISACRIAGVNLRQGEIWERRFRPAGFSELHDSSAGRVAAPEARKGSAE